MKYTFRFIDDQTDDMLELWQIHMLFVTSDEIKTLTCYTCGVTTTYPVFYKGNFINNACCSSSTTYIKGTSSMYLN